MRVTRLGRQVQVTRAGAPVKRPKLLRRGDAIRIFGAHQLWLRWRGNGYVLRSVRARVDCTGVLVTRRGPRVRTLVVALEAGSVRIQQRAAAAAAVTTPEALIVARRHGGTLVVRNRRLHRTRVTPRAEKVELAAVKRQSLRANVYPPERGIVDRSGLRLSTYPFAVSPDLRRTRRGDGLVPYWADGRRCSVGCHQAGAIAGWPLRPFRRQHALRAGLNELRPANFHVGIDIQARNYQAVYPMSSGRVHVIAASGHDERVQVGQFIYWHINHRVHEGQHVSAYRSVLGVVKRYYHHLHLSEVVGGNYLNPLRPGGRNLRPWSDTEPPIIGRPRVFRGGRAYVGAFDPQSFIDHIRNVTPVLAPAAVAWRLFDARGRRVSPLEWAYRGSQHLPDGLKRVVYAPSARNPGFSCFTHHFVCIPTWTYRLAGGLTPTLGRFMRGGRRYRLAVYAWDWAGNTTARDAWLTNGRVSKAAPAPLAKPPVARPDVQ
jgi:hypothetical protein